jgi:hypothetical protein
VLLNHKRGKARNNVRCQLCTDNRRNIGGDRARESREAFAEDAPRVTNGQFYDFCPDCNGTGKCECCPNKVCVLCGGTKIIDVVRPQSA